MDMDLAEFPALGKTRDFEESRVESGGFNAWRDDSRVKSLRKSSIGAGIDGVAAVSPPVAGAGSESLSDDLAVENGGSVAENEKESSVSGGDDGAEVSSLVADDAGSRRSSDEDDHGEEVIAEGSDENGDVDACDGQVSSNSNSSPESSVCDGDAGTDGVAVVSPLVETQVAGAGLESNSDDCDHVVEERADENGGGVAKDGKESSVSAAEVSPLVVDAGSRTKTARWSDECDDMDAWDGQVNANSISFPESSVCNEDAGTNGVAVVSPLVETQVAGAGLESNCDDCNRRVEERAVENGGAMAKDGKESSISAVEVSSLVADAGSRPKTARWSDECDDIDAWDGQVNSHAFPESSVSLPMETKVAGAGLKSNSDDRDRGVEERAVRNGGSSAKSRRNRARRVRKKTNKAKRAEESSVRVDTGAGFDCGAEVSPMVADAGTRPNSSEDNHGEEVTAERRDENVDVNACIGQESSSSNSSPEPSVCNGDAEVSLLVETPVAEAELEPHSKDDNDPGQVSSNSEPSPESSARDVNAEVSPVETPVADAGLEPQSDDNVSGQLSSNSESSYSPESSVCDGDAEVSPLVEPTIANDDELKPHSGEERPVENGSCMMTKNAKKKAKRKAKKQKESAISKPDSDTESKSHSDDGDDRSSVVEKPAPRVENGDAYAWQAVTYNKRAKKSSNPTPESSFIGDEAQEPAVEEVAAGENGDSVKKKPKKARKAKKKPMMTVAEAAAKIDADYLGAFLAEISVSHESDQDAQLTRFAEYFDGAFANVSEAQLPWLKQFEESSVHNLVDMPLSHIPENVLKNCGDWIGKRSSDPLVRFLESTLDGVVTDFVSNEVSKSQVARFVVLAMVLRRKPDLLMSLTPRHQFPLTLWLITQASLGDLSVGLYMWSHCLLTKLGKSTGSPQSTEMILQLVERILSAPKARTILLNCAAKKGERVVPPSALDILMRLAFPPSSARVKETERFEGIYPLLKEVALAGPPGSKAMKKVAKQIFDVAHSAKQDIPNIAEEADSILVWCTKQNPECGKKWEALKKEALVKDAEQYQQPTACRSSSGRGCIKSAVLVSVALAAVLCQVWFSFDLEKKIKSPFQI